VVPGVFGISGYRLTNDERAFFLDADPAGYILFGRNIETKDQVRALTDDLRSLHGRDRLLISIDQEGGRVSRLKPPVWPTYPSGEQLDRLFDLAPASALAAARASAECMGLDLAELGISCTHAPVLDIRQAGAHDVIGDRALGGEPLRVAALGRAILEGLAAAGIVGTVKHMPGHGRTTTDTHKAMPTVTASAEDLAWDIAPFRQLAHAPIGMTGHLLFTAWDENNPATHSARIIGNVIRGQIGFNGLLLTDDLDMEALSGTIPERAARSIAAGCDIALNCWAKMSDMIGIASVVSSMTVAAAMRLDGALEQMRHPEEPIKDRRSELLATRDTLLQPTIGSA
jgi:beta-N-acetylhexosaminidase